MTQENLRRDDVIKHVQETLSKANVDVEKAIVFGSVARNDHTPESDVDVIVVSSDFDGVKGAIRGRPFRENWDYETYGAVDFIEYTPDEYDKNKTSNSMLINKAEMEGIQII